MYFIVQIRSEFCIKNGFECFSKIHELAKAKSSTAKLENLPGMSRSDRQNTRTQKSFQSLPSTLQPIVATLFSGGFWRQPVHGFLDEH